MISTCCDSVTLARPLAIPKQVSTHGYHWMITHQLGRCTHSFTFTIYFFNVFYFTLFCERDRVSGGGAEREGDTESGAAGAEPDAGLELVNHEITT